MPIVFLLLFVVRLRRPARRRPRAPHEPSDALAYLNYVVPGLLLVTVAAAVQGTSIMVAMDMTGGIIDRFRTMAIARASVLTGHVLGSLIQTLAALAVLVGVAFGLGFRSSAGPLGWLAAIGMTGPVRLRAHLAGRRRSGWRPRASRPPATPRWS